MKTRARKPTALQSLVLQHLSGSSARTVLDVGCGSGRWARLMASCGLDVVGVDPKARPADVPRLRIHRCRHQSLAVETTFDAAIVVFVLHSLSVEERGEILTKLLSKDVDASGLVIIVDYQLGPKLGINLIRLAGIVVDELLASAMDVSLAHYREFKRFSFGNIMKKEIQQAMDQTSFHGTVLVVGYPLLQVSRLDAKSL